jgi:hypothetical protein
MNCGDSKASSGNSNISDRSGNNGSSESIGSTDNSTVVTLVAAKVVLRELAVVTVLVGAAVGLLVSLLAMVYLLQ